MPPVSRRCNVFCSGAPVLLGATTGAVRTRTGGVRRSLRMHAAFDLACCWSIWQGIYDEGAR